MKVLVIEDDKEIVDAISLAFQIRWPEAKVISTRLGQKGVDLVEGESPDIVILDLGLPDIPGFEVLRQIRRFSAVPTIILTVRADEADVVKGLEWGADDYITKPFRQLELLARVKSMIRRHTPAEESILTYGRLKLEPETAQLHIDDKEIALTVTENHILGHLMKNAGGRVNVRDIKWRHSIVVEPAVVESPGFIMVNRPTAGRAAGGTAFTCPPGGWIVLDQNAG